MAFDPLLPYDPPYLDYTVERFKAIRQQETARTRGGALQAAENGPTYWDVTLVTGPLSQYEHRNLEAWFDDFRGALRHAYVWPPSAFYPRTYPAGFTGMTKAGVGGAFTGTDIDVTAVTAYTITLGQLPANFRFRRGDYIGLVQGTRRALHRIAEDVQASGAGGAILPVVNEVRTNLFNATAIGNIVKPVVLCQAVAFEGDAVAELSSGTTATLRFVEVIK